MGNEDNTTREPQQIDLKSVWGIPLTAIHCAQCGAAHLVPKDAVPSRCPLCLQGAVTPQPAYLREEPPERVVPYRVTEKNIGGILDQWAKGIWFRPTELAPDVLARRMRRYLFPLWLVDGEVEAAWRADVGFDYQVVSYQDRYRDGAGWSSQELEETRIRWEPRVGRLQRSYDNLVTPALEDHRTFARRLGAYGLDQSTEYSPDAVRDATVRIPPLAPEAAWPGAEAAFARAAEEECQQAAGADHIRDFALQAEYHALNWTLLLLPAYVTWYREGDRAWPVLINGQNGRVSGVRRASKRKANNVSLILGAVGVILFLVGALLGALGAVFPPVALIGALGGLILGAGLLLAVVAPIPAISVWIHNRRAGEA